MVWGANVLQIERVLRASPFCADGTDPEYTLRLAQDMVQDDNVTPKP